MDPYFSNAKSVAVSDDGVAAGASAFGELFAEGSTLPDIEATTEALMDGRSLATGATAAYVIRVLNPDDAVLADLQAAVNDGTDRYFHFTNRGGTRRFNVGPAKVTMATERPPVGAAARGSALVAFNVAGDVPGDFFSAANLETT